MNSSVEQGEEASSSFTAEERAYYGSSTIAYKDSTPAQVKKQASSQLLPPPASSPSTPKKQKMSYHGLDLAAEGTESSSTVSWHEAHPIFAIVLVGPDEIPFGLQKDLLCAQSPYYRDWFAKNGREGQIEHVVKLPDTSPDVFGCFMNFVYTGKVYDKARGKEIPDYPLLMGVWKLATKLRMAPLRVAVLDCMSERRRETSLIPGTPLLIQAWKETDEGSGLRHMLIEWSAEHMRTSPEARQAFAKSLPQEILSELVIVMSELPTTPVFIPQDPRQQHVLQASPSAEVDLDRPRPSTKRSRKTDVDIGAAATDNLNEIKPVVKKQARRSEPVRRKSKMHASAVEAVPLSAEKELEFCRGLINRMILGPGYWTRLVKAFKHPVHPVQDNIPNYLEVIKTPMDLTTIKGKMERNEYTTSAEFEEDVRLIFKNCYAYWNEADPIYTQCQNFEKYFNSQWSARHKYIPNFKSELID
ncbi:ankyrin repeat-containing protein [Diplocarpon rosae]|nr:ankyrin repeat-containing protein [Diplocarpon rosae]